MGQCQVDPRRLRPVTLQFRSTRLWMPVPDFSDLEVFLHGLGQHDSFGGVLRYDMAKVSSIDY